MDKTLKEKVDKFMFGVNATAPWDRTFESGIIKHLDSLTRHTNESPFARSTNGNSIHRLSGVKLKTLTYLDNR